jgi:hypothetical protein
MAYKCISPGQRVLSKLICVPQVLQNPRIAVFEDLKNVRSPCHSTAIGSNPIHATIGAEQARLQLSQ